MQNNPAPSANSIRSKRMRWGIPLAACLTLLVGGGIWMAVHSKNAGTAAAANSPQAEKKAEFELGTGDSLVVVAKELRITLPVSGTLMPLSQATIKAKVPAVVQETPIQEGMKVATGQIIARLDTSDLRARFATQHAAMEEAQARLSLAKRNSETNQTLLKQKFISQNAFDTTQNSVELTQAQVKSAAAQLEIARLALADAEIRSPINGIVSKRFIQPGEKVSPDMPLFSIVNLTQLVLNAQVPASEIPQVRVGQEVIFNVDGFAGRKFSGTVTRINPASEAGSRSMLVYISVANADAALKGGMFATGSIALEKSATVPVIPIAAVRQENGATVIYRIDANKVVSQPVTLGLRNEDEGLVAVTGGLAQGTRILARKLDGVTPGSLVTIPDTAPPPAASGKKI